MGKTRWLLLLGAIQRALQLIFQIVTALAALDGKKSSGRLAMLTHFKMLYTMHLVEDFYKPIERFNGMHQSTHMTISQASRSWSDLSDTIQSFVVSGIIDGLLLFLMHFLIV